jgi:hypothetical protein
LLRRRRCCGADNPSREGASSLVRTIFSGREHLVCFALSLNPSFKTRRVSIRDRFTGRSVAMLGAFGGESLCVPSLKKTD